MDTHQTNSIRIVIADPCAITRAGLTSWLHVVPDIHVVAEADTADSLLEKIQLYHPDIVLLDYFLSKFPCLKLIQFICEYDGAPKVILMAHSGINSSQNARLCGARGYIFKNENREVFISAVRNVARQREEFWMSDETQKKVHKAAVEYESARLTPMEKKVLAHINHDNQTIADKLFLAVGTVRNHISSIYLRLNVSNRAAAVKAAHRFGVLEDIEVFL